MIKIKQLNKYFNKRKVNEIHVINDVSLEFPETGLVVLLGASGSGKTTLLNVIGGLDSVESGELQVAGTHFKKYSSKKWDNVRNRDIGYVFQNYNLLKDLSVFDNIAFVLNMIGIYDKAEIEKRVNYILQAVNMFKFRKKNASELSGGQQQRVAIARALVKNPKIIIADEPTGNLDSANTLDVMNIIKEISKQKLVVLVTHDRDLAKFYGDRIIEIQDGQVVSDQENQESETHNFSSENVIYLKDLEMAEGRLNENIDVAFYTDQKVENSKMGVKLIVKNNTLYLDINSNIKNVKLLSDQTGIVVKNEHYSVKSRENVIETQFDLENLSHDNVTKTSRSTISFKKSLSLAFNKIKQFGRRGKLMLFAFVVSGIQIAVASSMLFGAIDQPLRDFQTLPQNTISVGKPTETLTTEDINNLYNSLLSLKDSSDSSFYINPLMSNVTMVSENLFAPTNISTRTITERYVNFSTHNSIQFNVFLDVVSNVNKNNLVAGRMPENHLEFVIDQKHIEQLSPYRSKEFVGIWSDEGLFNLNFNYSFFSEYLEKDREIITLKIVGIVDSGSLNAYFTESMYNLLSNTMLRQYMPANFIPTDLATELISDFKLLKGELPIDNQVLLPDFVYASIMKDEESEKSFPHEIEFNTTTYTVSGIYSLSEFENDMFSYGEFIVANNSFINEIAFKSLVTRSMEDSFNINTNNPQLMLNKLSELNETTDYNLDFEWSQQIALNNQADSIKMAIIGSSVGIGLILVLTSVGFYFLIRSSLMTRIYEISVFRALGVNKKDIYKSFAVEILFITLITTLVGFALGTYVIIQIVNALAGLSAIGGAVPLTVNILSVLSGLVVMFAITFSFGLLPVFLMLRKTPSQILSKYDI